MFKLSTAFIVSGCVVLVCGAARADIAAKNYVDDAVQVGATATNGGETPSVDAGKIVVVGNDGKITKGTTLGTLATASSVTSSDITDGTITNADISGTAAIADSKISATGSVASGNTGLVTGGVVYTEVRPAATNAAASGTGYLGAPASTTAAENIAALDTALKAIHPNTGEVKVPIGSATSSTLGNIWIE